MKIRVIKKGARNQLVCTRTDGSTEISDIGPTLPYHDIAHFVVESTLGFQKGFYGNIAAGFTVKQLSDKNVIRTLPAESMIAEILTRALQSVQSGAVSEDQFEELVQQEFQKWSIRFTVPVTETRKKMLWYYRDLLNQWNSLEDGQFLELEWKPV